MVCLPSALVKCLFRLTAESKQALLSAGARDAKNGNDFHRERISHFGAALPIALPLRAVLLFLRGSSALLFVRPVFGLPTKVGSNFSLSLANRTPVFAYSSPKKQHLVV
jgi:hypothetical protein